MILFPIQILRSRTKKINFKFIPKTSSFIRPNEKAFKKQPLERFTAAKKIFTRPWVKLKTNLFTQKKPELVPDCPQIEDENYWTKYTEKYLFDNDAVDDDNVENIYLEPLEYGSEHDYVDIEAIQRQQQQQHSDSAIYHNVEDVRIEPVPPFVEPYEQDMRKKADYNQRYDCYYDTKNRILSDEENQKRFVLFFFSFSFTYFHLAITRLFIVKKR